MEGHNLSSPILIRVRTATVRDTAAQRRTCCPGWNDGHVMGADLAGDPQSASAIFSCIWGTEQNRQTFRCGVDYEEGIGFIPV